jgi:Glycine zipper 2TM domain
MRKLVLVMALAAFVAPALAPESANARPRTWRGRDGHLYCKKRDGTVGMVIGGVGGALVGRTIDTHGDRTVGTVLGATGGALLGREVMRRKRCE